MKGVISNGKLSRENNGVSESNENESMKKPEMKIYHLERK